MIELLYSALNSPLGTVIATEGSFDLVRADLYRLRKMDPDLKILSFVQSPVDPTEIWIVKNAPSERS